MNIVFYGVKYRDESGGVLSEFYDELTGQGMDFYDICKELATGQEVHIRPATVNDCHALEAQLVIVKAKQAAVQTEMIKNVDELVNQWLGDSNAN